MTTATTGPTTDQSEAPAPSAIGSASDSADPGRVLHPGGEYGPYIMARYTTGDAKGCRLFYTMSTWNPYQVVVMRTDLKLE